MSIELSDKLNAAFGNAAKFHELIDSHWPEIDRALRSQPERLRSALAEISENAPTDEPVFEFTGNGDDARDYGSAHTHWWAAEIARKALKS